MEKIRLADIAESLGLSVAAVSYVLNGKEGKVSARTRARVLEMVKKAVTFRNVRKFCSDAILQK